MKKIMKLDNFECNHVKPINTVKLQGKWGLCVFILATGYIRLLRDDRIQNVALNISDRFTFQLLKGRNLLI